MIPASSSTGNSSVCCTVQNIQSCPSEASASANDSAPIPIEKTARIPSATSTPPRCRSKLNGVTTIRMIAV